MIGKNSADPELVGQFIRIGRVLFEGGLNNSHSGNMSMRVEDRLLITRRGSMLGALTASDLIDVNLEGDGCDEGLPSTEVNVHRSVYAGTGHLALVHAHPRAAIALSMNRDFIIPIDAEGRYYFHRIPVLAVGESIGSKEVEEKLPDLLKESPLVMVRGHGAFAGGATLEDGLKMIHSLEWSCEIFMKCLVLGMEEKDLRDGPGRGD